jgi:hypothetical protein
MSQQKKLEKVLDLLLSEDQDQAAELLHQIIVEKARVIYESVVEEEADEKDTKAKDAGDEEHDKLDESDEVGGNPNQDFTKDIASDKEEIDGDEQNDGEAGEADEFGDDEDLDDSEDDDMEGEDMEGEDIDDRVDDLETQLSELRAEFDALMGEEMMEPNHADLAGEMDGDEGDFGGNDMSSDMSGDMPDFGGEEKVVGEVVATMFEKKKVSKLKKAPEKKDLKKDKKVDEETQFLKKTGDTGQKSANPGFAGTGKDTPKGAEQDKSIFSKAPSKPSYGGDSKNILGSKSTGGEYGKYHGDSAADDTITDNLGINPKKSSIHADKTAKYTGGKAAGEGFTKSPLTKAPSKPGNKG